MPVPADIKPLGVVQGERVLKQRAIAFIKENPARYLVLCLRRVAVSLASDTSSVVWNETGIVKALGPGWLPGLKLLCTVVHWLLLITAGAALVLSLRRRDFGRSNLVIGVLILLSAVPFVFVVARGNRIYAADDAVPDHLVVEALFARPPRTNVCPINLNPTRCSFSSKKLARRMLYAVGLGALSPLPGGLLFYGDMGAEIVGNLRSFPLDVLLAALLLSLLSYAVRCCAGDILSAYLGHSGGAGRERLIFVAGLAIEYASRQDR